MSQQSLTDSIWWILPGQLAGMRKPDLSAAVTELDDLRAEGIGAVVSVMDDPSNLDHYEAANIPHRWFPTQGGTAPTREQIDAFCTFVDASLTAGLAVAVHCSSGRRRTATFLGAYLIQKGTRPEDAIAAIAIANPDVEMRPVQLEFLRNLAHP